MDGGRERELEAGEWRVDRRPTETKGKAEKKPRQLTYS